jgi:hypothetical protein
MLEFIFGLLAGLILGAGGVAYTFRDEIAAGLKAALEQLDDKGDAP